MAFKRSPVRSRYSPVTNERSRTIRGEVKLVGDAFGYFVWIN